MATVIAHIAGDWTAQRTPLLLTHYPHPAIEICNDITGEPVPPDSPGVWEVLTDDTIIAAIDDDNRYLILWSGTVTDGI